MLERDEIAQHPQISGILKKQASRFLEIVLARPKVPAVFGTQQRYLLTQLAMAMVFESKGCGILLTHYLDAVQRHGIASRNTAQAFVQQMIHYGMCIMAESEKDRRARPLFLSRPPVEALEQWMLAHLCSLDQLDGGNRALSFRQDPALLERVHPLIVRQVFLLKTTMDPKGAFSLFTWINDGGLLMDKMISSIPDPVSNPISDPVSGAVSGAVPDGTAQDEQVATTITSFDELSDTLRVTRTHISRKILEAEKAGYVGWSGKRGASPFWVSKNFVRDYQTYQIDKLVTVEWAFAQTLAHHRKHSTNNVFSSLVD